MTITRDFALTFKTRLIRIWKESKNKKRMRYLINSLIRINLPALQSLTSFLASIIPRDTHAAFV